MGEKRIRVKRKVKYKNVFLFLFFFLCVCLMISYLLQLKITNVYITNTTFLKDHYILEKANLKKKPTIVQSLFLQIEQTLEKDVYIKSATVKRKNISEIHIEIEENFPVFYNSSSGKTVLENEKEVEDVFDVPILLNYVPDKKYKKLIKKMAEIDQDIRAQISEIKYDPNDKDDGRFLFSMIDGNYVYVTLNKLTVMNSYMDIMLEIQKKFNYQKGILYLDSGQYFEVLEN